MSMTTILAKTSGISLSQHIENLINNFNLIKPKLSTRLHFPTELAIILHDIGKALPYFQLVKLKNKNYHPIDLLINIEHSIFSTILINKDKLKELLDNNGASNYSKLVLSAIAFHHWRDSFDDLLRFGSKQFKELFERDREFKDLLIKNLQIEFQNQNNFNLDLFQFDNNMLQELAEGIPFHYYAIPPYQLYYLNQRIELGEDTIKDWILIAGFLIRCDHFASYCEEENISESIEISNISKTQIKQKIIDIIHREETEIWQFEKVQSFNDKNTILIAPTGIGKTEFAFVWAGEDKFFYTLPLRAAVEQTFERAKKVYNINGEDKVGLLHFDSDVYLITDDQEENAIRLYDNARQLAYPVTISTGDQFFPYALRPPGYEKIYSIFSYARLVIDEIQAYDPIAAAITVKFAEDVVRMGGKVLVMTATFPSFVKKEILERFKRLSLGDLAFLNLYEEEKNKLQNLIKHKIRLLPIDNTSKNEGKKFDLSNELINEILERAENNRVLLIFNTISQAQETYAQLKEKCEKRSIKLILLHSRFTFNDREKLQSVITNEFKNPKPDDENCGKILIATQVVESAIDIDVDYLYTEIAPLDALIQRMGRVLRRYRENLTYNGEPNVIIFLFKNGFESGEGRVYSNELILLTKIILCNFGPNGEYDLNKISSDIENQISSSSKSKQGSKLKLNLTSSDIQENNFCLSEYKKYELVNLLFELLEKNGDYLQEFYQTLEILDAGYMSDKKLEALKKFRPMVSTSVISLEREEELKTAIQNYIDSYFNHSKPYAMFKKYIISRFVVNIIGTVFRKRENSFSLWIENLDFLTDIQKQKLKRWTEDIYFVPISYDKEYGLDKKIDEELERYYSRFL